MDIAKKRRPIDLINEVEKFNQEDTTLQQADIFIMKQKYITETAQNRVLKGITENLLGYYDDETDDIDPDTLDLINIKGGDNNENIDGYINSDDTIHHSTAKEKIKRTSRKSAENSDNGGIDDRETEETK